VRAEIFGYAVEKVSDEPGKVAYHLYGKKAVYRLVRNVNHPHIMYALNTNGNICGIKGNYTFSDESGDLLAVNRL
jgi:hypothetical protein